MEFLAQYKAARRVSTPLVAIRTFDANSTLDQVRSALGEEIKENGLILWDVIHGLRALSERGVSELTELLKGTEVAATVDLVTTLNLLEAATHNVTVFISNAHLHWASSAQTDPSVVQGIWNLRDGFKANGNMLILLCSPGSVLPQELANDVMVLDEPLPTVAEIRHSIQAMFKFAKLEEPGAEVLDKATDALIGVPAFAAEQSTAMCLDIVKDGDKRMGKLDLNELWEHKRQVIAQTPGLSVWKGDESLEDIGGLEQIKKFYHQLMNGNQPPKVIIFIDEIEKAMAGIGTDMSGVKTEMAGTMLSWMQDKGVDGVICIGLPGVSKSQLAKAVGGTYDRPVVNFDIGGMQSGIIGSSGTNLRTAQKTVEAISGDRVLCIATCNSIHALPPELRRRFNLGTFFFDAPTAEERKLIWEIHRRKFNIPTSEPNPGDEGWTGAEIRECCQKSYRLRITLAEAAAYIVPITRSSAHLVHELRSSCSGKYLSASKPGVYVYDQAGAAHTAVSTPTAMTEAPRGRVLRMEN